MSNGHLSHYMPVSWHAFSLSSLICFIAFQVKSCTTVSINILVAFSLFLSQFAFDIINTSFIFGDILSFNFFLMLPVNYYFR